MPDAPATGDKAPANPGTSGTETAPEPVQLPEDHPLVKTLATQKAELADLRRKSKDNAAAAARLAEIEDAQKTEAQRAADALAAEKKRADDAERLANSLRIATEHHLGADDAELLAGLPDEDSMKRLAERLAAQAAGTNSGDGQQTGRVGYGVDNSSTQSNPPSSKDDEARAFFGI